MREKVYQILYCSRNNMETSAAERAAAVEQILEASRRNNAKVDVTGALFHNTVLFAQVLEGNFAEVQRIFERLQLDGRHSDLVVLQSGFVAERDFQDWSMAYASRSSDFQLPFSSEITRVTSQNGEQVLSFLREVVLKQETWALPERKSSVRPLGSAATA